MRVEGWPPPRGLAGAQGSYGRWVLRVSLWELRGTFSHLHVHREQIQVLPCSPSLYSRVDPNLSLLSFPRTWNIAAKSVPGSLQLQRRTGEAEKVCAAGRAPGPRTQHLGLGLSLPPGLLAFGEVTLPPSGPQSLNFYGGGIFMVFLQSRPE